MDIHTCINTYDRMNICGVQVHCPYWKNVITDGKVVLRGVFNGKGSAEEIQAALSEQVRNEFGEYIPDAEKIIKTARRRLIGIDCSGFAYRCLTVLIPSMDTIFPGGITRTNVMRLTDTSVTRKIEKISDIQTGDLIRMMRGNHVLIVESSEDGVVKYAHSSSYSKVSGVHRNMITITDPLSAIEFQQWNEEAKNGENFGKLYYHPEDGDGIYRLLAKRHE